jgi:hypothetical protein
VRSSNDQPYRPLRIPPKISVECDLSNSAAFMVPHSRLNDLLDIQLPIRQEYRMTLSTGLRLPVEF